MAKGNGGSEVALLRRDVELAKADLADRVRAAAASGRRVIERATQRALPVVFALGALGAAALALGLYKLSRPRYKGWTLRSRSSRPSLVAELARAILVPFAGRLATRLAARFAVSEARQLPAAMPSPSQQQS
jgi:hypothetical protein